MRLILVLSILAVLIACSPTEQSESLPEDLSGFDVIPIPGTNSTLASIETANGPLELGMLSNGKRHGTWVSYHDNQKRFPKVIATYAEGKLNGFYAEYSERGQLELVATYLNNQLHGWYAKYKYTRILESREYVNGILDGTVTKYFPDSDQVQQTIDYKEGKQHGLLRYYNEAGKVTMEYQYENGQKVSGGMVE
jgi:antitoxin component YwqK of YwqJK toxin-antitoxin module